MGTSRDLWLKRLKFKDTLSRGQCRQFGNAIVAGAAGYEIGGHKTNLTPEECTELETVFNNRCVVLSGGGYKLEPEHAAFGLEWLNRDRKRAAGLGVTADHLDTFEGFRFIGGEILDGWSGPAWYARANVVPVYRVLSRAGTVDYWWSPWQNGGGGNR